MTALLIAVQSGHQDGLCALLERGADVNARSNVTLRSVSNCSDCRVSFGCQQDGSGAAHYACKAKNGVAALEVLMENGIDLEAVDQVRLP